MTLRSRAAVATQEAARPLLLGAIVAAAALTLTGASPLGFGLAAMAAIPALARWVGSAAGSTEGWFRRVPPAPALRLLDADIAALGARSALTNTDYDHLVGYFAAGVAAYRSPRCALVLYPAEPGTRGARVEGLEGFARSAPLLAAWVTTRADHVPLPGGGTFDAFDHLRRGIIAGTDPAGPEAWGFAGDLDQRIVEAADVALAAWMLRERLRACLPAATQTALLQWLATAQSRAIYGGNWYLFRVLIGLTREAWGQRPDPTTREALTEFCSYYLGDGWFTDGPGGRVDFYNAWQMHFALAFVREMAPELDRGLLTDALRRFAETYLHLFAPQGFPIFGRSCCYRTALPAPLVLATALCENPLPAGPARRALDATWTHFIARGALAAGALTQGYEGPQPDLLENYSGRGSCHWGLRSLVAAYWQPPDGPIWTATPEPLPVEQGSYQLALAGGGLQVVGDQSSGVVEVRPLANSGSAPTPFRPRGRALRLAEMLLRRPLRHANIAAKYGRPVYRSDRPFFR